METFSALLAICAGNSPVHGEFPAQRPVTRNFDVYFDMHRIISWVNNREAGDLRRNRAHYDVIVMPWEIIMPPQQSKTQQKCVRISGVLCQKLVPRAGKLITSHRYCAMWLLVSAFDTCFWYNTPYFMAHTVDVRLTVEYYSIFLRISIILCKPLPNWSS